jgi:hypothetical protein
MAQSKGFFGLRKGSTKSLTFSTLDGKQAFDIDWKKIQSGVSQFRKASSEYLLNAIRTLSP